MPSCDDSRAHSPITQLQVFTADEDGHLTCLCLFAIANSAAVDSDTMALKGRWDMLLYRLYRSISPGGVDQEGKGITPEWRSE
ncbi:uncharacterized protein RBU33_016294 isoform 2-T5 [Hipposideros larvatus]